MSTRDEKEYAACTFCGADQRARLLLMESPDKSARICEVCVAGAVLLVADPKERRYQNAVEALIVAVTTSEN